MLVLIAGLRYETGGDWEFYGPAFDNTNPLFSIFSSNSFITSGMEIGYLLFCSIVKQFGGSLQTVYFLIVLFNITLITKSLKEYTKYIIVGLLTYYGILYFLLEMIYTRQSVAVSICFYAMIFVKKENFVKYMVCILFASLFHTMSIVLIPLYFLFKCRINTVLISSLVIVGCILMLFHVVWIERIFVNVSSLINDTAHEKALVYITTKSFAVPRTIGIGYFLNLIVFLVVILFRKKIEEQKMGNIFINLFFISLFVYYYMYEIIEVSNRFRYMFMISIIVLFPYFIQSYEKYLNKLLVLFCVALYSFAFSSGIFLERPQTIAYYPYQNYLIYKWFDKKSTGKERLQKSHEHFSKERR
jgi:hypothetical protein